MKDGIILFLLLGVVAITIFFGVTTLLKKTIKSTPKVERSDEYNRMMRSQRHKMQELEDRQKQMMRDQQQRIRDMQRR